MSPSFLTPPCITAYVICGSDYLLIRRCFGSYLDGTWQMVTGKANENETAIQAALREIKEETGLTPLKFYNADTVESFHLHHSNRIILVPVFVAFVEKKEVSLCPEEHDAFEWLSYEQAREKLVWSEQKRVLAHVHENFVLKQPHPLLKIE